MSIEEPSSGRPEGPPSGPLAGPSEPGPTRPGGGFPSGPSDGDADRSGGGGSGGPPGPGGPSGPEGEGPKRPWWKSAPRVAVITAVVVAAVVLAVVLSSSDGGSGSDAGSGSDGEVFLQPAAETGPDPFTESSATESSAPPETPSATPAQDTNVTRSARGDAPGLYGGTRDRTSCDVEKQITFFRSAPGKNGAFASVQGIQSSEVPDYLRSLTPLQLRYDTRVTNHGYRNGTAAPYQAVLQTGTAVLVDDRGVPRARCACGNPLTPPVAQKSTPKETGTSWPMYRKQNVVVVQQAATVINVFVALNVDNGEWFERRMGDTGGKDKKTNPPTRPAFPSASTGSPTGKSPTPSSSSPAPTSSSPTPTSSSPTPSSSPPESSPSQPTTEEQSPPTAGSPDMPSASDDLGTPGTDTGPAPGT